MNKIILTDADGVLVTWLDGFETFMFNRGYKVKPDTEHMYSMAKRYGITETESRELVRQFNESSYIESLPPYLDSVEYIPKLIDHGFKFICISSLSSDSYALEYRRKNLENLYGDNFLDIICLEMGAHKRSALTDWEGSGLFWIEDHIKNAEAGHELGLKSVLVQHEHNEHYDTEEFPIVGPEHPWRQIYELVCKEYNLPI
jgi:FMN phosphatase YigB (HAD superfamily)